MKILVTGAGGLVGRAMVKVCADAGDQIVGLNHTDLDVADEQKVNATIERERPELVINCAAWTDVDGCELDPQHAQEANARGPEFLASACRSIDAQFITISTDYVFDGEKDGFYTQHDEPKPISIYGMSKLEGERRSQLVNPRTIVVRSGFPKM